MLILAIVLFFSLTSLVGVFGYYYYARPSRLLDQLQNSPASGVRFGEAKQQGFSWVQWLKHIGDMLPISPADAKLVQHDIIAAGIRSANAIQVFYGAKVLLAAVLLVVALLFRDQIVNPLFHTLMPVIGAGIGFMLPRFILDRLISRRNEKIRLALPDVLDLLVVCTEAGCGIDQAIINVARELRTVHPDVSEELSMINMEIMAGTSRADAMRSFAKRIGEDEIKKLVALLIQTDRFGTSVADALRTQSDYLRIRRRQEAEERAGKVGVKLVFPIFFFCLPSLLVVTAGPGVLQLIHNLASLTIGGQ